MNEDFLITSNYSEHVKLNDSHYIEEKLINRMSSIILIPLDTQLIILCFLINISAVHIICLTIVIIKIDRYSVRGSCSGNYVIYPNERPFLVTHKRYCLHASHDETHTHTRARVLTFVCFMRVLRVRVIPDAFSY